MNDESGQPPASDDRDGDQRSRAVVILIILMVTALVCVGSYFFLKNMVAATRRDNCLISGQWCSGLERKLHGQ
jgi:hypothetical protein